MAIAAVFMAAGALCELAIPHFTSKTIFAVTKGAPQEVFQGHLHSLAAAAAGFALFAALRGWLFGVLNNRFVRNLRSRLFAVLMREETAFHGEALDASSAAEVQFVISTAAAAAAAAAPQQRLHQ